MSLFQTIRNFFFKPKASPVAPAVVPVAVVESIPTQVVVPVVNVPVAAPMELVDVSNPVVAPALTTKPTSNPNILQITDQIFCTVDYTGSINPVMYTSPQPDVTSRGVIRISDDIPVFDRRYVYV